MLSISLKSSFKIFEEHEIHFKLILSMILYSKSFKATNIGLLEHFDNLRLYLHSTQHLIIQSISRQYTDINALEFNSNLKIISSIPSLILYYFVDNYLILTVHHSKTTNSFFSHFSLLLSARTLFLDTYSCPNYVMLTYSTLYSLLVFRCTSMSIFFFRNIFIFFFIIFTSIIVHTLILLQYG